VWESIRGLENHIETMQVPHPRAFFHDKTAGGAGTDQADQYVHVSEETQRAAALCDRYNNSFEEPDSKTKLEELRPKESHAGEWLKSRPFPDCLASHTEGMGWRCKHCGYDSERKTQELPPFHSSYSKEFRYIPLGVCCICAYPDRPPAQRCPTCRTRHSPKEETKAPVPAAAGVQFFDEDDSWHEDDTAVSGCPCCLAEFDDRCSACRRRRGITE
jgi:hypothetical protein